MGSTATPNLGAPWNKLTTDTYDGSTYFNGDLAICKTQPETLWFLLATTDSNKVTTILRTDTDGVSWDDIGLPPDFSNKQANYNEAITVNPNNPDLVLVGGVHIARSDDGGANWTTPNGTHADHHIFEWNDAGTELWEGSDGGVFHSTDQGQNFDSSANTYPISQFFFLSVCPNDPSVSMGGLQDNGVTVTTDGMNWEQMSTGDGGGVAIDPDICSVSWNALGVFDGPKAWLRNRSMDTFGSNVGVEDGIDDNPNWYPYIKTAPYRVRTYTHAGGFVYWILDADTTWHKLNSTVFPDSIYGIDVERGESGAVYATLANTVAASSGRIQVYKDGAWSDGDAPELPAGIVRAVVPNPTILGRAYAILNSVGYGTGNLFMTTDWGESYTDISGIAEVLHRARRRRAPERPQSDLRRHLHRCLLDPERRHELVRGEHGHAGRHGRARARVGPHRRNAGRILALRGDLRAWGMAQAHPGSDTPKTTRREQVRDHRASGCGRALHPRCLRSLVGIDRCHHPCAAPR